jgi:hypothetical protein
VTRIEITRHTAADPAGVALLLSEASEVSPVRRSGVGFAADVEAVDSAGHRTSGRLSVVPSVDAGCEVRLALRLADQAATESAEAWARTFLDSLARRAQGRASAA